MVSLRLQRPLLLLALPLLQASTRLFTGTLLTTKTTTYRSLLR